MFLTLSGSKKEIAAAISSLEFVAGKVELTVPEVIAEPTNGNGHKNGHPMSPAARKRISESMKARWANKEK